MCTSARWQESWRGCITRGIRRLSLAEVCGTPSRELDIQLFIGRVMGTSVGTRIFVHYGCHAASAVFMAWFGFQLAILLVRGRMESEMPVYSGRVTAARACVYRYTWFGYEGRLEVWKSVVTVRRRRAT